MCVSIVCVVFLCSFFVIRVLIFLRRKHDEEVNDVSVNVVCSC